MRTYVTQKGITGPFIDTIRKLHLQLVVKDVHIAKFGFSADLKSSLVFSLVLHIQWLARLTVAAFFITKCGMTVLLLWCV